jgi:hypothetical protein
MYAVSAQTPAGVLIVTGTEQSMRSSSINKGGGYLSQVESNFASQIKAGDEGGKAK